MVALARLVRLGQANPVCGTVMFMGMQSKFRSDMMIFFIWVFEGLSKAILFGLKEHEHRTGKRKNRRRTEDELA